MASAIERHVLRILNAVEITPDTARSIEEVGTPAVTAVCDVATGCFPGLRVKMRSNATALLGRMLHRQAKQAVRMLITDPIPDVAICALRAAARLRMAAAVSDIGAALSNRDLPPLVAVEAVKALREINNSESRRQLHRYEEADASELPHRGAAVVANVLRVV